MGISGRWAALLVTSAASFVGCISLASLDNGPIDPGADASDASREAADLPDSADASEAGPDRAELYRAAVVADSPLAYWRFDETAGNVAKDEMGAHPGVYRYNPALGSEGLFGPSGAVQLPTGSDAHVDVPGTDFSFSGNAPYTVEVWVKPTLFADYEWMVGTESTPPRTGWSVAIGAAGEVLYEVWRPNDAGSPEVRALATTPIVLGRFQHVVISFNGNLMKGFIDGVLVKSDPAPRTSPDGGTLMFGCRQVNDGTVENCLAGWSLDEAAIYDYPLADARVSAHYELGKP